MPGQASALVSAAVLAIVRSGSSVPDPGAGGQDDLGSPRRHVRAAASLTLLVIGRLAFLPKDRGHRTRTPLRVRGTTKAGRRVTWATSRGQDMWASPEIPLRRSDTASSTMIAAAISLALRSSQSRTRRRSRVASPVTPPA
jgi:hypothetical protein